MPKDSDPNTKGGGKHGPPKRWTGGGPRPARHIPWPELFKHHQSVLTGHLKMMDMVRKHCIEGTGNYETAKACVDRTHEMMRMFKQATFNFVPPKDNLDRVPLGASSASMYPGYSPADHIYGEAAQEYGQHVAELKRKGVDLETDPNGPQYVVGQNKKPRRLTQELEKPQSTGTPSTSAQVGNGEEGDGEPMEGVVQSGNDSQYFVIDSKPTPVAELGESQKHKNKANDKAKRRVSFTEEGEVQIANTGSSSTPDLSKASETTMESFATTTKSDAAVPDEDISGEVEARLKAKEEKRKQKEEKKRKRESENSLTNDQVQGSQTDASGPTETSSTEKRKKKKHKKDVDGVTDAADAPVKAADETKSKGEKKKKKKRADTDEVATVSAPAEEKLKKMRKKEAASSE